MSRTCTAGGNAARARIQRAARSIRLRDPSAAVDTLSPSEGPRDCWTIEATLPDRDSVSPRVYGALADEKLDIVSVDPQGQHRRLVATA